MEYLRISVLVVLACCNGAFAQIQHGTTIVINKTNDKIMVAADSRGFNFADPPDDCECKIAALGKYTIYAASGAPNLKFLLGTGPSWNSSEEAHKAYRSLISHEGENNFASMVAKVWGRALAFNWSIAYKHDSKIVLRASDANGGYLVRAFFGWTDSKGQNLVALFTEITVDPKRFPIILASDPTEDTSRDFWTLGIAEMVNEFINPKSEITKLERAYQLTILSTNPPDADIWKIARYVQLEITYHVPGRGPTAISEIGGSVDAVTLTKGEGVRWFQRKSNCPAE